MLFDKQNQNFWHAKYKIRIILINIKISLFNRFFSTSTNFNVEKRLIFQRDFCFSFFIWIKFTLTASFYWCFNSVFSVRSILFTEIMEQCSIIIVKKIVLYLSVVSYQQFFKTAWRQIVVPWNWNNVVIPIEISNKNIIVIRKQKFSLNLRKL